MKNVPYGPLLSLKLGEMFGLIDCQNIVRQFLGLEKENLGNSKLKFPVTQLTKELKATVSQQDRTSF
jgi:hypothetical protein